MHKERFFGGWFDLKLTTSWDPDLCYRLRREGYRVAVLPGVEVQDLGEGKSTVQHNIAKGNYDYNKKWNKLLLGKFIYKCPGAFLRWEHYPLNVLFRQLVNAQQGTWNADSSHGKLSGHTADNVYFLACRGNYPTQETLRKLLDADVSVRQEQTMEDIDPGILTGKRQFDMDKDLPVRQKA